MHGCLMKKARVTGFKKRNKELKAVACVCHFPNQISCASILLL